MRQIGIENQSAVTLVGPSARQKSSENNGPYSFLLGDHIVQPQLNRILIEDRVRKLEPRCMDLLVFFAEHPLEVHSRVRLVDEVWRVKAIATTTLTHAIAQIRKALGDDARGPRYIETIHCRGYRLVIEPEEFPEENLVAMGDLRRKPIHHENRGVPAFDNRGVFSIYETRGTRNGRRFGFSPNPGRSARQEVDPDFQTDELVFHLAIKLPQWIRSRLWRGNRGNIA